MAEDLERHEAIAFDVFGIDHETPSEAKEGSLTAETRRRREERREVLKPQMNADGRR
jgi:hypothetical protein